MFGKILPRTCQYHTIPRDQLVSACKFSAELKQKCGFYGSILRIFRETMQEIYCKFLPEKIKEYLSNFAGTCQNHINWDQMVSNLIFSRTKIKMRILWFDIADILRNYAGDILQIFAKKKQE